MNKVAVIDLGTNTCNLLIAGYDRSGYKLLYQGKEVVKMGKGGINKNIIPADGLQRAIGAIRNHQQKIKEYKLDKTIVIATSAVRDASNRETFCKTIKNETGIALDVISGEKEAELIFKGVLLAFDGKPGKSLILDIGGGSNEFILCDGDRILWKESFPLGVARIIERFPPSNPITEQEIDTIRNYYEENMGSLWEAIAGKEIDCLIGCSGAFDTVVDLIDRTEPGSKQRKQQEIGLDDFQNVYKMLIRSTTEERLAMKELERLRVEMIVPAVILIGLVMKKTGIRKMVQTDYALREGVLYDLVFI